MLERPSTLNVSALAQLIAKNRETGVRGLVILSGSSQWCWEKVTSLADVLEPCITIAYSTEIATLAGEKITPAQAHHLLGQEIGHVVFDGTQGVDCNALAAVSGAMTAGALLILLLPPWQRWASLPDKDSLRWAEQETAIATPHFVAHFKRCFARHTTIISWQEGEAVNWGVQLSLPRWQKPCGKPTAAQHSLLKRLLTGQPDIYVLTAPRGRGKSALAGMLIARWQGACVVTSASRDSAASVLNWAGENATYLAPDNLLLLSQQPDFVAPEWLIIDEAATLPTAQLTALIALAPRVLLMTTVLGYEGTGKGFLLKFCAGLPSWQALTLDDPIRWAASDPLEQVIDDLLLFHAETQYLHGLPPTLTVSGISPPKSLTSAQLAQDESLLRQFYGLLSSAHYRTSPLDLRRLLDAPQQHFTVIRHHQQIIAALWVVEEGGLSETLAHEVWAGRRRPKGNLVAQSLSAHGGYYHAPLLHSRRISRIAVEPHFQRHGLGQQLIATLHQEAQHQQIDYLSVSFGYTESLAAFWQACGFTLIHEGHRREASSGVTSAMAVRAITAQGQTLIEEFHQRNALVADNVFSAMAWRELAGFAFGARQVATVIPILRQLSTQYPIFTSIAPLLYQHMFTHVSISELTEVSGLAGRKAILKAWRNEVARFMEKIDSARTAALKQWVSGQPRS